MRFATFNVLADAYTSYGDYSHVDSALMQDGARLEYVAQLVNNLNADVIGLQEADKNLVEVFEDNESWQTFWKPKGNNKPDGCLTLIKNEIEVTDYEAHLYNDETGHVFQLTRVGEVAVANTHIKWAPEDEYNHTGVSQTRELLTSIDNYGPAVILADCNGRPRGRVQTMVEQAGFRNLSGEMPTAIVNGEPVALDLLATRGLRGVLVSTDYNLHSIPNTTCASDHIPIVADINIRQL